ncbi:MAG TPA: Bax inhibitor-1/YccA family protein [Candidatus Omnitrophota bacterium]|nr:Bax inhibitor-1/YccA family protein [Candidatus Omnitrophota bacterium]
MRTANPALNEKTFSQIGSFGAGATMTLQGTINKTFVLLILLVISASWVWNKLMQPAPLMEGLEGPATQISQTFAPLMMFGLVLGFVAGLVTIFKKAWSPVTAPVYALCEGLFIGGISAIFELNYPGIVVQAIALTFGTLFCLLMAYKSGMVKATENFKLGIVAATGAICLIYLVSWVMSFFGASMPFIHDSGPWGIGFSLVVVTIAALNLVLDFDFIEHGSQMGLPRYMEWYAAFGLIVTLVWLYIEILRLLSKLRDRR